MIVNKESLKVEFDDVVTDQDGGEWSQICKECVDAMDIEKSLLDDVGSGICGVKGCSNESDYYIDFEQHKY